MYCQQALLILTILYRLLLHDGLLYFHWAQQEPTWLTWKSHAELPIVSEYEERSRDQTSQMPAFPLPVHVPEALYLGEQDNSTGRAESWGFCALCEKLLTALYLPWKAQPEL